MASWKELKEQGIRRCCAENLDGGRCRRRVAADNASHSFTHPEYCHSYCGPHGRYISRAIEKQVAMLKKAGLMGAGR